MSSRSLPRLKTELVEQRWRVLALALLLERVSTVRRSRGASHDQPVNLTDYPNGEFGERANGGFAERANGGLAERANGGFAEPANGGFSGRPDGRFPGISRLREAGRILRGEGRKPATDAYSGPAADNGAGAGEPARVAQGEVHARGRGGEAWQRLREYVASDRLREYFAGDQWRALQSAMSRRGGGLRMDDRTRGGLLALAVAVSVGIHIGLTPEHLKEMPRLGVSFIVSAVLGAAIAAALICRPTDRRIAGLAGVFCLAEILIWALFVTIRVPFFPGTPEPVETIALVSKAVEVIGWVLALALLGSSEVQSGKRATSADRAATSGFSSTSTPTSPASLKVLLGRSLMTPASPTNGHKAPPVGRS